VTPATSQAHGPAAALSASGRLPGCEADRTDGPGGAGYRSRPVDHSGRGFQRNLRSPIAALTTPQATITARCDGFMSVCPRNAAISSSLNGRGRRAAEHLMDLRMPGTDGITAIERIWPLHSRRPLSCVAGGR
jgi:hypothetical protein